MFDQEGGKVVYTNKKSKSGKPLRAFKCEMARGKECSAGPYYSVTPKQAASKAFSAWCRTQRRKSKCATTITIRETTKGSKKKPYTYNAQREVLRGSKLPQVQKDEVNIAYKYNNRLYSTKSAK